MSMIPMLLAAAQAPPPDLSAVYEPDEIASVEEEIETLEGELDVRHPGWRQNRPFDRRPDKIKHGIKLVLKRLDLVRHGRRDWGCYIDPKGNAVARPPAKRLTVQLAAYQMPVSPAVLAGALDLPIEAVEAAVAQARAEGQRPTRAYIRRALRAA